MSNEQPSGGGKQTSFVDPVEKIRRVLSQLKEIDFDLVRINMSGGKDSFLVAEAIRRIGSEFGITIDVVAHYQTGTNIPSTTDLVKEYCAKHDLPYIEGINPEQSERVGPQMLDYGQYGAGEGRAMADRKHSTAFILRKERVEEGFYRGFSGDMLILSGTYHDESDSRGSKMSGAIKWGETGERKPRATVASPIYALTSDEVDELCGRWGVEEAPAYDILGSSGDCTGCAYDQAGRFANLWVEAPNLAFCHATLMVWTQMRRARGDLNLPPERVIWGWGSLDEQDVAALRAEDEFYDASEEIGPTSVDVAATKNEEDEEDGGGQRQERRVDHELKQFVCSDCDDRCDAAMPVTVADGGEPADD